MLLTMPGSQVDETDWENMTNKELHDKYQQMMGQQVEDVMTSFGDALARMDAIEKSIDTKLDAKFDEYSNVSHNQLYAAIQ